MRHIFSPEGDAALAETLSRRPLLAFDFDGTLAPTVAYPADAAVPLAVSGRLNRLAMRLPVIVISGRSVADVRERLPFAPRVIVGSHGAEVPSAPTSTSPALFDAFRECLCRYQHELAAAGVTVEDKTHSIALHYRLARQPAHARSLVDRLVATLDPELRARDGAQATDIVAARAPEPAKILADLATRSGSTAVLFTGRDVCETTDGISPGPQWLTIRVGRIGPRRAAHFGLDSASDIALLLDRMLDRLDRVPR
jgi:trehalose 6-phosphate phosphatase